MFLPSFTLSKNTDGTWVCAGEMPESKRPFRFECGKGSKANAAAVARERIKLRLASSKGSRDRWARTKARQAAAAAETLSPGDNNSRPPVEPPAAPAPHQAPRPTDDDLRAKLLGLGDARPIPPDDIYPGGGGAGAGAAADDDPPIDNEGGELIASILAKGAVVGLVGLVNRQLRKRKPPAEGEPHEKGLEWFHDGMEHQLKKLLGRTATLGPTAKIFAGAAIIVGSMYMNAEPLAGAAAAAAKPEPAPAAPPPAPAAPPPAHHSNGTNGTTTTALARTGLPLGVFGVERVTAN